MTTVIVVGLVINAVFLIFHPAWASSYPALFQSLGVNAVLFVVPALPLIGAWSKRGESPGAIFVKAALVSFSLLIAVLGIVRLTGWSLTASGAWNGTWLLSNLLLLACAARGLVKPWVVSVALPTTRLFILLFVSSYGFYLYGALAVVPEQYDHDLEVQATGYGLLTRFEPFLLTDRNTIYYFAHPPLLHMYTAASFLYYDQLAPLKTYDDASRRAFDSSEGRAFAPPAMTHTRVRDIGVPPAYPKYKVTAVEGDHYVVSPPLPDGSSALPIQRAELATIYSNYASNPHKLETRTPNIFFAAMAVALLGYWIATLTRQWSVGLLLALAYATSPEVFVRSSYGGYFAIGSFALLAMMGAAADREARSGTGRDLAGFLAGMFAACADHKLVLFPLSLILWRCLQPGSWSPVKVLRAVSQPVAAGFLAGMALYWIYGSSINLEVFWLDHVKTHFVDRITHNNPLGYDNYPTVSALWGEFNAHTGYLLLPLGILTLGLAMFSQQRSDTPSVPRTVVRAWAVYGLVTAVVFSWADWRMTKHLMLLIPVLFLAPALWAAGQSRRRLLISAGFLALLCWNLQAVYGLVNDFSAFPVSPAW